MTEPNGVAATGRGVLVAGIGQNMGRACAERLLRNGDRVLISDVRPDILDRADAWLRERVPDLAPDRLVALSADAREGDACALLAATAVARFGSLDVLVSCIGRSSFGLTVEMEEALFQQELQTNVVGNFLLAQAVARVMIEQNAGGRIILFSSGAGSSARRGGVSHCSSKAAVNMLTKVLALELGPHGITVNAIAPGLVPKPGQVSSERYRDAVRESIPLGRLGSPEDVAGAVAFLASPDAAWITGEVLQVNGGSLVGRFSLPVSVDAPRSSF